MTIMDVVVLQWLLSHQPVYTTGALYKAIWLGGP